MRLTLTPAFALVFALSCALAFFLDISHQAALYSCIHGLEWYIGGSTTTTTSSSDGENPKVAQQQESDFSKKNVVVLVDQQNGANGASQAPAVSGGPGQSNLKNPPPPPEIQSNLKNPPLPPEIQPLSLSSIPDWNDYTHNCLPGANMMLAICVLVVSIQIAWRQNSWARKRRRNFDRGSSNLSKSESKSSSSKRRTAGGRLNDDCEFYPSLESTNGDGRAAKKKKSRSNTTATESDYSPSGDEDNYSDNYSTNSDDLEMSQQHYASDNDNLQISTTTTVSGLGKKRTRPRTRLKTSSRWDWNAIYLMVLWFLYFFSTYLTVQGLSNWGSDFVFSKSAYKHLMASCRIVPDEFDEFSLSGGGRWGPGMSSSSSGGMIMPLGPSSVSASSGGEKENLSNKLNSGSSSNKGVVNEGSGTPGPDSAENPSPARNLSTNSAGPESNPQTQPPPPQPNPALNLFYSSSLLHQMKYIISCDVLQCWFFLFYTNYMIIRCVHNGDPFLLRNYCGRRQTIHNERIRGRNLGMGGGGGAGNNNLKGRAVNGTYSSNFNSNRRRSVGCLLSFSNFLQLLICIHVTLSHLFHKRMCPIQLIWTVRYLCVILWFFTFLLDMLYLGLPKIPSVVKRYLKRLGETGIFDGDFIALARRGSETGTELNFPQQAVPVELNLLSTVGSEAAGGMGTNLEISAGAGGMGADGGISAGAGADGGNLSRSPDERSIVPTTNISNVNGVNCTSEATTTVIQGAEQAQQGPKQSEPYNISTEISPNVPPHTTTKRILESPIELEDSTPLKPINSDGTLVNTTSIYNSKFQANSAVPDDTASQIDFTNSRPKLPEHLLPYFKDLERCQWTVQHAHLIILGILFFYWAGSICTCLQNVGPLSGASLYGAVFQRWQWNKARNGGPSPMSNESENNFVFVLVVSCLCWLLLGVICWKKKDQVRMLAKDPKDKGVRLKVF